MASQKDTKSRIASVKNIQKITKAMEMVAAARLRRAEQRIEAMRPYADAIRRMTGRVVEAVGAHPRHAAARGARRDQDGRAPARHRRPRPGRPLQLADHARGHPARATSCSDEGKEVAWYASGKRGISSLSFRGKDVVIGRQGFTDRPAYSNARDLANDIQTRVRRRATSTGWR